MRNARGLLHYIVAHACLAACTAAWSDELKPQFKPVDTSRVMGSPNPMPLEVEPVYSHLKFTRPLEFTHAPDGSDRLFVVEQEGRVFVFPNDLDVRRAELFLDISDVVSRDGNEEGLWGLAFHPNYRKNGELFVCYPTVPRASVLGANTRQMK